MSDGFVDAYVRATGAKQRIPAEWLTHPVLGPPFAKTPRQKAAEPTATTATTKAPAAGDEKAE